MSQARDAMMEQVKKQKQTATEGDVHMKQQLDHALNKKEQLEDMLEVSGDKRFSAQLVGMLQFNGDIHFREQLIDMVQFSGDIHCREQLIYMVQFCGDILSREHLIYVVHFSVYICFKGQLKDMI